LVRRMARRYLDCDGNIREVLQTLFFSDEFWDEGYYGVKFKTPYEFVISAARAYGVAVVNVRPLAGAMNLLGMPLYQCQTPDGYKQTQNAWLSPDAMTTRVSFATALGAGRLPLERPIDGLAQDARGGSHPAAGATDLRMARAELSAPLDSAPLMENFNDLLSRHTLEALEAAPVQLRAPLILGSPEFMMR